MYFFELLFASLGCFIGCVCFAFAKKLFKKKTKKMMGLFWTYILFCLFKKQYPREVYGLYVSDKIVGVYTTPHECSEAIREIRSQRESSGDKKVLFHSEVKFELNCTFFSTFEDYLYDELDK